MIKPKIDIKNPKHQMMMLAFLIAVLGVILYFSILLKPQVIRVANAAIRNNKMKAELKCVEGEIANIDKYKKGVGAYKDKVERYERMLPAEQEIPVLLESLSSMARSSGVKIVGITPAAVSEEKKQPDQVYQEIPILISAKSGYHELGNFLAKLEDSDRFMKIANIKIIANKVSPKKHEVELLVLTYIILKGK